MIGIFPTLTEDGYLTAYKEWLAQEGADSIQLPESFDGAQLEHIFQTTNGFLIPGGGSHLSTSAQGLVERAVKANQAGDFYPVWGTCLGFEWIMEIFGGLDAVTGGFDAEYQPAALKLTAAAKTSRLYSGANASLLEWVQTEQVTYNAHSKGISPACAPRSPLLLPPSLLTLGAWVSARSRGVQLGPGPHILRALQLRRPRGQALRRAGRGQVLTHLRQPVPPGEGAVCALALRSRHPARAARHRPLQARRPSPVLSLIELCVRVWA